MHELTVDIITAEKSLVEGAVAESLIAPGVEGEFEVLPGHTTLLTGLEAGVVTLNSPQGPMTFAVSGGFAEVMMGHVRILADKAVAAADISAEEVKNSLSEIEQQLSELDPFSEDAESLRKQQRYLEVNASLTH